MDSVTSYGETTEEQPPSSEGEGPEEDLRAGPKLIGQPPKGKRFNVQQKRQLAAGLQVLCRTCTPLLHTKALSFQGPAVAPPGDGG